MLTKNKLTANPIVNSVLNCDKQDSTGLNDFQQTESFDDIYIPKVGITNFKIPISFKDEAGGVINHDCLAKMYVSLASCKTGINMSRLNSILQESAFNHQKTGVDFQVLSDVTSNFISKMYDDEIEINNSMLQINFNYCMKVKALKSDNWGIQYYPAFLRVHQSKTSGIKCFIGLSFEYSSTCPCSLSMALQYQNDYHTGKTEEGIGIAVAHSQRSRLQVEVQVDKDGHFFLPNLIKLIRQIIPTETLPMAKRIDEQAFAVLNGSNPLFVEHIARKIYQGFNSCKDIYDWAANIEHFESLHSHNAAAVIYKGIDGGLRDFNLF